MKYGKLILNERISIQRVRRFLHYYSENKITQGSYKFQIQEIENYITEFNELLEPGLIRHSNFVRSKPAQFTLPMIDYLIPFYKLLLAADDAIARLYRLYALGRIDQDKMRHYRYSITSKLDRAQRELLEGKKWH